MSRGQLDVNFEKNPSMKHIHL